MPAALINGLGGSAGFGENTFGPIDDGSTNAIDLTSVFSNGINFFGQSYDDVYVNNNGSISFGQGTGAYYPIALARVSLPAIFGFWHDVDTYGGAVAPTPGGTSQGTNLVHYDLDPVAGTFTVTWDDVGRYSRRTDFLNAFQIILTDASGQPGAMPGDFDIEFRYEAIEWTTSDGNYFQPARAGFTSASNGFVLEIPGSGDLVTVVALEDSLGNTGLEGVWRYQVRNAELQDAFAPVNGSLSGDMQVGGYFAQEHHGLAGNDSIYGGEGADTIYGNSGRDFLEGGFGNDRILGGLNNDTLLGGGGDDNLSGQVGYDSLNGGSGNDSLRGGVGRDTLMGEDGRDRLDGGFGDDSIDGGAESDVVFGRLGADTIADGDGRDIVNGGGGADLFLLGAGDDAILSGYGGLADGDPDVFVLDAANTGADTILGFDVGIDLIDLNGQVATASFIFSPFDLVLYFDGGGSLEIRGIDEATYNSIGDGLFV